MARAVYLLRASHPFTLVAGPAFQTAMDAIEIEVTSRCNLKCLNCDASCSQAPDDGIMTVQQIEKFVRESVAADKRWARIHLTGGEAMLHPDISEILEVVDNYRRERSPATVVKLLTNGSIAEVNDRLRRVPGNIKVINSRKTSRQKQQDHFEAFNLAPCDQWYHFMTDFVNGCWVTNIAGCGLNRYGYYPCVVAGAIDRVFGFDIGIKQLPGQLSAFDGQKRILCRYCGHFPPGKFIAPDQRVVVRGEPRSKRWMDSYKNYHERPPVLTLY
jgi:hypothetical protein